MPRSCATWLVYLWHDSFICDMTQWHPCERKKERINTRNTHMCHYSVIYECHYSVIYDMTRWCVTWLVHLWHDSVTPLRAKESESNYPQHPYVSWLGHLRHDSFLWDMTRSFVSWLVHLRHDSYICDMTQWHPCEWKKAELNTRYADALCYMGVIYIYIHIYTHIYIYNI